MPNTQVQATVILNQCSNCSNAGFICEVCFCDAFPALQGSGNLLESPLESLESWHTWYRACLRVAQTLASSPTSSVLLAPRLVCSRRHAGVFCFIFSFSLRRHHAFALHCMIICKHYVSAMAAVTNTWCHSDLGMSQFLVDGATCVRSMCSLQRPCLSLLVLHCSWEGISATGKIHILLGRTPLERTFQTFPFLGLWIYNVKTGINLLDSNVSAMKKIHLLNGSFHGTKHFDRNYREHNDKVLLYYRSELLMHANVNTNCLLKSQTSILISVSPLVWAKVSPN